MLEATGSVNSKLVGVAGTATCGATNECASISGSVANNTAVVEWTPVSVASQVFTFTLGYQVI